MIQLCLNHYGGPLGVRAEHLHKWLRYVTQEGDWGNTHWRKVVYIFQIELRNGTLSDMRMWQTLVKITKGCIREFSGVGLVEVLWNTITGLLNRRFALSIGFFDVLNGFWSGIRMGTASLGANLIQYIMAMR